MCNIALKGCEIYAIYYPQIVKRFEDNIETSLSTINIPEQSTSSTVGNQTHSVTVLQVVNTT